MHTCSIVCTVFECLLIMTINQYGKLCALNEILILIFICMVCVYYLIKHSLEHLLRRMVFRTSSRPVKMIRLANLMCSKSMIILICVNCYLTVGTYFCLHWKKSNTFLLLPFNSWNLR